ncbi:MAG TPA: hypothetical protein VL049_00175, partial [Candidatus Dormibacteraeota bacterium]|nr:hypothetical protein [Candidatus Dormibacteraeota bacterium]
MRCAILIGLVLLASGCGDDSTDSHASSCSVLGDPEVSCRFVGRFSADANRSTVVVKADERGDLLLLIGPHGGKPRY